MATGHGNTPAAWTGVTIMFVGCLIGAVAVILASIPWLIGGGVVILLGVIVGKVMVMMGLGEPATPPPLDEQTVAAQPSAAGAPSQQPQQPQAPAGASTRPEPSDTSSERAR